MFMHGVAIPRGDQRCRRRRRDVERRDTRGGVPAPALRSCPLRCIGYSLVDRRRTVELGGARPQVTDAETAYQPHASVVDPDCMIMQCPLPGLLQPTCRLATLRRANSASGSIPASGVDHACRRKRPNAFAHRWRRSSSAHRHTRMSNRACSGERCSPHHIAH